MLNLLLALTIARDIKVYGAKGSPFVQIVRSILGLQGEKYELIEILPKNAPQPEPVHEIFEKLPWSKIPAFQEGGFIVWDSGVISRYLDHKYGHKFSSKNAQTRAKIEAWAAFITGNISVHTRAVGFERFIKPSIMKIKGDEQVVQDNLEKLKPQLGVIEKELRSTRHQFIGGNTISLADITLACHLDSLTKSGINLTRYMKDFPELIDWWKGVSQKLEKVLNA